MGSAQPNDGHRALARIDPTLLITQNVDGLVTTAPPKDRDVEAAKARARAELRYGT